MLEPRWPSWTRGPACVIPVGLCSWLVSPAYVVSSWPAREPASKKTSVQCAKERHCRLTSGLHKHMYTRQQACQQTYTDKSYWWLRCVILRSAACHWRMKNLRLSAFCFSVQGAEVGGSLKLEASLVWLTSAWLKRPYKEGGKSVMSV